MPKRLEVTLGSTSAFEIVSHFAETRDYAIAQSTDSVGVTWNPSDGSPQGFPHTYNHQQWFILPDPLAQMVLGGADLFESENQAEQG